METVEHAKLAQKWCHDRESDSQHIKDKLEADDVFLVLLKHFEGNEIVHKKVKNQFLFPVSEFLLCLISEMQLKYSFSTMISLKDYSSILGPKKFSNLFAIT